MRKNLFKLCCMVLACSVAIASIGCGGGSSGGNQSDDGGSSGNNEKVNKSMTQFYIGNYAGGVGSEWLDSAQRQFEKLHKDTSFEAGKKGVQIWIKNEDKGNYADNTFINKIGTTMLEDMHVTNSITLKNYVNSGKFIEITDIVTEKSEDVNGAKVSIEDKMDKNLLPYYNFGGKYYAIPLFNAPTGIVYDNDLFEKLGFKDDGPGMDGVTGTEDDGLPQTWEDFSNLLDTMVTSDVIPFTWSYKHAYYRRSFLDMVAGSYEGYNNFNLNFTLNGTDSELGEITPKTAYKLLNQQGKFVALKVAEKIFSGARHMYYSSDAFKTLQGHTEAQSEFLSSIEENQRIAMILEGGWWENECRDVYDEMALIKDEYAYGKRDFRFMSFPKFKANDGSGVYDGIPDQKHNETVLYSTTGNAVICISNVCKNVDLAKEFIKFISTNKMMAEFTTITGLPRPYEYDLTDDQLSKMTSFGRSIWNLMKNDNKKVVYKLISDDFYKNQSYLDGFQYWYSKINNDTKTDVFNTFYTEEGMTADKYFQGMKDFYDTREWAKRFEK